MSAQARKFAGQEIVFLIKCELSGIRLSRQLELRGGIRAVPTAFLWLRSAKMARNGAGISEVIRDKRGNPDASGGALIHGDRAGINTGITKK